MPEKNKNKLSIIEETMLASLQNKLRIILSQVDEHGNPRKMTIEELIEQEKQETILRHDNTAPTENFDRAAIDKSRDDHLKLFEHIEEFLKQQQTNK